MSWFSRVTESFKDDYSDGFWLPKPRRFDMMTVAILIPVLVSAFGLFLMSIESFVFVQFGSLSTAYPALRASVALLSGLMMAFGGEVGTVANNTEVFSKFIKSKLTATRQEWDIVSRWDWIGFGVSWLATTLSVIIASSTRELAGASWQSFVSEWFIIPMMIIAVGDIVFGTIELGFRLGAFDARMSQWIGARKKAQEEIDYLKRLSDSDDGSLRCWCGHRLKNETGYNRHQTVHRDEARKFSTPAEARSALMEKYAETIGGADIEFPGMSQVIEWRR